MPGYDVSRDSHLLLVECWDLGVQRFVARLCRYFSMSHHQQNFDETGDSSSGLGVADITLNGAEMEKGISLSPTESVADTADLDGIANTGCMKT